MFRPNTVPTTAVTPVVRQLQILIRNEQVEDVADLFRAEDIDFIRQEVLLDDRPRWLVTAPVPTDAISYLFEQLDDAGIEDEQYMIVSSVETAITPNVETLRARFASDFDPLTEAALRSKVLDLSHDKWSFLPMLFFSAVIATAGLLVDSPAVVVGSMVIAPIVGPVLTGAVGAATGDREMLFDSIWLQGLGLTVAILGAWLFSVGLQATGFLPSALDISSISLITLRISPGLLTVFIGLASGAAGAYGVVTKGPTSLIGVMIAAALIPAAATVGIAMAWGQLRIAAGSLLLLALTVLLINLGAYVTLQRFPYRPEASGWLLGADSRRELATLAVTVLLLVSLVGVVGVASYQHISFERTVNEEVQATLDQPEYDSAQVVATRIQYGGPGVFPEPETVTVVVSRPSSSEPPTIAQELKEHITAATDQEVTVRVQFEEYQHTDDGSGS